jgi:hypothetical protein
VGHEMQKISYHRDGKRTSHRNSTSSHEKSMSRVRQIRTLSNWNMKRIWSIGKEANRPCPHLESSPSPLLLQATFSDSRKFRSICENVRRARGSRYYPTPVRMNHFLDIWRLRLVCHICTHACMSSALLRSLGQWINVVASESGLAGVIASHDTFNWSQESLEAMLTKSGKLYL